MPKLFGTSGIRGSAEDLFTKEFCIKLGVVFGTWLKEKGKSGYVAVAMDPRDSSPRIKDGIVHGLATQGWEVLDEGVIPTPALTYFVKQSPHVGGGVMITGSHITASLNGVKLFIDGEEVTKAHEAEIEALFANLEFKSQTSTPIVKNENAGRDLYVQMLTDLADLPYPKWKIVMDTANGAQSEIVRELLEDFNLELICSDYCDIQSPHFVPRDTESRGSVNDLMHDVLTNEADLGVAFDVDGDRVVFVDDAGQFVPGDYSCTLIAQASDSEAVVTPINTSSVVDHIGKKVFRTKVGSTNVALKMKETGAKWGFEANGGGISAEIFYGRDGASTMIKLLNLLKVKNQALSALLASLPQFYLYRDKFDCPPDKYAYIYTAAQAKYKGKKIDLTDGIKVYLSDEEWILFRSSGNAPEFRVFVQAEEKLRSERLGQEALEWAKSLIASPGVSHTPVVTDSLHIKQSLLAFPQQFAQVVSEIGMQDVSNKCMLVKNIVVAGMGGSALGGRIIQTLEQQLLRIPLIVSTEFHLPNFVNEQSLVIVSSYSGNTEETLTALQEAISRNALVYILTSGGKLAQIAHEKDLPAYIFDPKHNPSGQPRMGLGYSIATLLYLLSRCQLISPPADLSHLSDFLTSQVDVAQKNGQELAQRLVNKSVILLSSEHLKGAAHAVKNMLNENSKNMSFSFDLPEANHHLLEGLTFPKSNSANFVFVTLKSALYRPEVQKRYAITAQVIAKQHLEVVEFPMHGPNPLLECLDIIQTGGWLSYHLAAYNQVDPGPIPWVDYFKDQL